MLKVWFDNMIRVGEETDWLESNWNKNRTWLNSEVQLIGDTHKPSYCSFEFLVAVPTATCPNLASTRRCYHSCWTDCKPDLSSEISSVNGAVCLHSSDVSFPQVSLFSTYIFYSVFIKLTSWPETSHLDFSFPFLTIIYCSHVSTRIPLKRKNEMNGRTNNNKKPPQPYMAKTS